jgi:high affinity Mn2+ porin
MINQVFQRRAKRTAVAAAYGLLALLAVPATANKVPSTDPAWAWDGKGQATYIWQRKNAFSSPYQDVNSLLPQREKSYSFSTSAYLGLRVPGLGELYLNPEVIQGVALSGLVGLGSFSNGEMQKVSGATLKPYLPRLFLRRDWALSDEREAVEAGPNQLAGSQARDRVRLTLGKFAITDVFDANAYAHDSRTQFLTWASLAHGAYDYAADAQGFSVGAALEYRRADWAARIGRFMVPEESNGAKLSWALGSLYGDQVEIEHAHEWRGQPGAVRLLAWRNREKMGSFQEALDLASAAAPRIDDVRRVQAKSGLGLHLEQALSPALAGFVRYSWADGRTENYSFEEVDRSSQIGLNIKGLAWSRPNDNIGLLAIANSLSGPHRQFLAQGGMGYFIGDGRLNYRDEQIFEAYYSWAVTPGLWLSFDLQHYRNPAYNRDRGPVNLGALRMHIEL